MPVPSPVAAPGPVRRPTSAPSPCAGRPGAARPTPAPGGDPEPPWEPIPESGPLLGPALAARARSPPADLPNAALVLALGLDEYLGLVYSQLAGPAGVSRADVRRLCALLAASAERDADASAATVNASVEPDASAPGAGVPAFPVDGTDEPALGPAEFRRAVCARFGVGARPPPRARLVEVEVTVQRRAAAVGEIERRLAGAPRGGAKRRRRPGAGGAAERARAAADEPPVSLLLLERELEALRELVEDLRRSLAVSDARNIGLQVRARRSPEPAMGGAAQPPDLPHPDAADPRELSDGEPADSSSPTAPSVDSTPGSASDAAASSEGTAPPPSSADSIEAETNRSISQAQRNFDSLIRELRAISQPRAPFHPELSLEDELERTHEALQHTQSDLERSRAVIRDSRGSLRGKDREVQLARQDLLAAEAAAARAQEQVEQLQSDLQASQHQHEMERLSHERTEHQLSWARAQLTEKETALEQSRATLRDVHLLRRKLLSDLTHTRHLVVTAVCRVRELEATSGQVPALQARIHQLEALLKRRSSSEVRPASHVDSGLYSTSESDHEEARPHNQSSETTASEDVCRIAGSEDTAAGAGANDGAKRETGAVCRTTPEDGRVTSPGDRVTLPAETSSDVIEPRSRPESRRGCSGTPTPLPSVGGEEEHDALVRLEEQVQWLRQQFLEAEQEWEQERRQLMEEVAQRQEDCQLMAGDVQHLEQEQQPLLLLQERTVSVLDVLQNLRQVNISPRALGRLVLDALERCQESGGGGGHQRAFRFLTALHRAASGYERLSTESLIQLALEGLGRGEEASTRS